MGRLALVQGSPSLPVVAGQEINRNLPQWNAAKKKNEIDYKSSLAVSKGKKIYIFALVLY